MTGKSHLCFGFGAFLGVCALDMMVNGECTMSYSELAVGLAACELGSLAPDIDHPQSKISTADVALGLLSRAVCTVTSHRRHTHTLLFCLLGGIGAYLLALLTIRRANSSTAFLVAIATFFILQMDETSSLRKVSSIIAIGVYIGLPFLLSYVPMGIPTVTIPLRFAKYVGFFFAAGCFSHVAIADCACKEGCPLLWPLLPMNKHFRFAYLTTGSMAENIVAAAAGIIFVGCAYLLFQASYFQLPF